MYVVYACCVYVYVCYVCLLRIDVVYVCMIFMVLFVHVDLCMLRYVNDVRWHMY